MSDDRLANIEKMLSKLTGLPTTDEIWSQRIAAAFENIPKTFQYCGHPFPQNIGLASCNGVFFEQIYTCAVCGTKEGYP